MDTKKLTRLAGLCAICVITRIYLKLIPNVQILSDIILILGFGYWVIFQVLDFGILGISNYILFNKIKIKKTKINKVIALGISGFIYGFLITIMQVLFMSGNIFTFFGLYAGSIPFDINHMVGNIVIYIFLIIRLEKYITGEKHFKN